MKAWEMGKESDSYEGLEDLSQGLGGGGIEKKNVHFPKQKSVYSPK